MYRPHRESTQSSKSNSLKLHMVRKMRIMCEGEGEMGYSSPTHCSWWSENLGPSLAGLGALDQALDKGPLSGL